MPAPKRKLLHVKPLPKTALKNGKPSATVRAMLDDRSYMRANPHRSTWSAAVTLLVAVVVCFALQEIAVMYFQRGGWVIEHLALSTGGLRQGFIWQLITFQFLHVDFWHLLGNGIGLWFFGRFVEERLGSQALLKLYFLAGICGGALQAALGLIVPVYFGSVPTFGASAGVFGLIAAFALMEPESAICVFFVLPIKAKYFLWISAGIAAIFTLVPAQGGSYAHAAHLGGILAGVAYMCWDARRPVVNWDPLQGRRRKRQLVQAAAQVARWRSSREQSTAELPPEEFISREVDPILDKISAHGIHSLTPRERQILEAARSKIAKR